MAVAAEGLNASIADVLACIHAVEPNASQAHGADEGEAGDDGTHEGILLVTC